MSPRARQLRQAFFFGLTLFIASILSVTAYTLWRLRTEALANSLQVSALHARSFEDFLTQSLRVIELANDNTSISTSQTPDLKRMEGDFVAMLRHTPFLRSMSLQDNNGRIVASSNAANIGLVVSTQSYLPKSDSQQGILRVGQPWAGRDFADGRATTEQVPVASDEQSFIPITQTLQVGTRNLPLLIALNPDYFLNHMASVLPSEVGSVEILRYDGTLLMSTDAAQSAGSRQAYVARDLRLEEVESGAFGQTYEHDRQVLTAFRASRLYPFLVVTHFDRERALLPWLTEVKTLLGVLMPVLLAIFFLAIAFYRRQLTLNAQRAKAEQLRINATVFDASSEAIIITDADANILAVNAAFTHITGYTAQEALGQNPRLLVSGRHDRHFYEQLWRDLLQHDIWKGEVINRRKDGSHFDARLSITVSYDAAGAVLHYVGVVADITERKQAEAIFRALFDQSSFLAGVLDQQACLIDVNSTALQVIDAPREAVLGKYFPDTPWWSEEQDRNHLIEVLDLAYHGTHASFEARHQRASGGHVDVMFSAMPIQLESGNHVAVIGVDITARKQAEDKLRLAASVFANSREGIIITTSDGAIIDVNDAFSHITGYSHDEVIDHNPRLLSSGRQDKSFFSTMWQSLIDKGHWYGELWNRRKNGEVYAEMLTISAVRDARGTTQHYVALFSDITATRIHLDKLEHIAHFDALTNMPNRLLLADRLHQAMSQALRRSQVLAVVYLDLDGFKAINDIHGHEAGDQLLITVSSRMNQVLREGDTLARIGGDEFVAVLVDLTDPASCAPLLTRLLAAAAEPMILDGNSLQVSASLGVTFFPQFDEIDANELQRQADQAMYLAKVSGKNRYHLFDAKQDSGLRGHHESLAHIRQALDHSQLVLHYQPKVNMRSGQVVGAEALIRWQHPERGLLTPAHFLPTIESHPLAIAVGEWVLHSALAQIQTWHAAGLDLAVSVNIGARQLQQPDFVARLQTILGAHPGVEPTCLMLEVIEASALEDIARVSQVIASCRALGVMFALDDFGTGYSSLTYLKRLPVVQLKIDQGFVHNMLDSPDDLATVQGVIGLAHAFHREVIAEGVETLAHGTALLQMGCELAQGYGFAQPMPAAEMVAWVKAWQSNPA
jgi:diguanylate cyclase (GGDEF)-like protein/PAS domain S-box-containing protein